MSVKKHIKAEEKGGVLVLNLSYQPIGTTPLTRALLKLRLEDSPYTVEEWGNGFIHRPDGTAERKPSVVRLKYWDSKIPVRGGKGSRTSIYQRDKFTCQYCAKKFGVKDLTLDHVFPKSKGGENDPTNLVTACKVCNNRKADRTPEEARMPLINPLTVYKVGLHRMQLCHYAEARPEWKPYLFMEDVMTGTNG